MFGFFQKKQKPTTTIDGLIKAIYGDHPPKKSADAAQAASLAANELLGGAFDNATVMRIANELDKSPIPYSTYDLAVSVALNLLKSVPPENREQLFEIQAMARMTALSWFKEGKVVAALAQSFEHVLYERYKPTPPGSGSIDTHEDSLGGDTASELIGELAEILAHNATTFPTDELLVNFLPGTGYRNVPESRLRFGLSIANEVLNICLINERFPKAELVEQLVDSLHQAFYSRHPKTNVVIGDFVVAPDEIEQVKKYMESATGSDYSDIQSVQTTLWSLLDVVYVHRQEVYRRAHDFGRLMETTSQLPEEYSPMTYMARKLATHVTGDTIKSGGASFAGLAGGLEYFLNDYVVRTRDTLPTVD